MKKNMLTLLTGIGLVVLLLGGCAKKDVVRGEEGLVPKTDTVKAEPRNLDVKQVEKDTPATKVTGGPGVIVPAAPSEGGGAKASAAKSGFETIYFDFDKSDLRQDARTVLNQNAEVMLKSQPAAKIKIEGHCDERGSAEYNLALGERRAKSSLQYLTTLGVKADRLSIISYGKEKPAVQGSDEDAWAKNRRSEFVEVK